jgi:hypothetical protein
MRTPKVDVTPGCSTPKKPTKKRKAIHRHYRGIIFIYNTPGTAPCSPEQKLNTAADLLHRQRLPSMKHPRGTFLAGIQKAHPWSCSSTAFKAAARRAISLFSA